MQAAISTRSETEEGESRLMSVGSRPTADKVPTFMDQQPQDHHHHHHQQQQEQQHGNMPTESDFDNALTHTNLAEFEMATMARAHPVRPHSPKRQTLKIRSRSNSPNPRTVPYADVHAQRRRAHSSSLAQRASVSTPSPRKALPASFRNRCYTTPDQRSSNLPEYAVKPTLRSPYEEADRVPPPPPAGQPANVRHVVNGNIEENLARLFNVALGGLATPQSQPPLRNRDLPESFWNPSRKSAVATLGEKLMQQPRTSSGAQPTSTLAHTMYTPEKGLVNTTGQSRSASLSASPHHSRSTATSLSSAAGARYVNAQSIGPHTSIPGGLGSSTPSRSSTMPASTLSGSYHRPSSSLARSLTTPAKAAFQPSSTTTANSTSTSTTRFSPPTTTNISVSSAQATMAFASTIPAASSSTSMHPSTTTAGGHAASPGDGSRHDLNSAFVHPQHAHRGVGVSETTTQPTTAPTQDMQQLLHNTSDPFSDPTGAATASRSSPFTLPDFPGMGDSFEAAGNNEDNMPDLPDFSGSFENAEEGMDLFGNVGDLIDAELTLLGMPGSNPNLFDNLDTSPQHMDQQQEEQPTKQQQQQQQQHEHGFQAKQEHQQQQQQHQRQQQHQHQQRAPPPHQRDFSNHHVTTL